MIRKTALACAVFALMATPAVASETTSTAPQTSKAKAYGKLCAAQSRKHVEGQKGTPFSQCVTAMAKAAKGTAPKRACSALSKKRVAGEKGTAFSRCVVAAAKLQRAQASS